jgi:hypothetical protein
VPKASLAAPKDGTPGPDVIGGASKETAGQQQQAISTVQAAGCSHCDVDGVGPPDPQLHEQLLHVGQTSKAEPASDDGGELIGLPGRWQ